ncbi:hypothetical protein DM02DRAFT_631437 [Periconia macrospinosa]|uniref:Signal recognition particle, SRP19 subunit n=1 Tax=Periconia macrospinosa TaxID=97972 RepID=A0A2V1DHM5_9PLEO|nr:hypothetical protein DM02DRAFT_631437 [Periconia macrospinosa]
MQAGVRVAVRYAGTDGQGLSWMWRQFRSTSANSHGVDIEVDEDGGDGGAGSSLLAGRQAGRQASKQAVRRQASMEAMAEQKSVSVAKAAKQDREGQGRGGEGREGQSRAGQAWARRAERAGRREVSRCKKSVVGLIDKTQGCSVGSMNGIHATWYKVIVQALSATPRTRSSVCRVLNLQNPQSPGPKSQSQSPTNLEHGGYLARGAGERTPGALSAIFSRAHKVFLYCTLVSAKREEKRESWEWGTDIGTGLGTVRILCTPPLHSVFGLAWPCHHTARPSLHPPPPPPLHLLSNSSRPSSPCRPSPAMNPRVEEVSDSDSDPEEMDISNLSSLMTPSQVPASSSLSSMPPMPQEMLQPQGPGVVSADREKSKHYQCLYPVYFDKSRTRAEGRRVGAELAVENPLAREMADAVASLGLSVVFEPDKLHPKDWSNPGRIRVLIKQKGQVVAPNIRNKHHLYILVSKYLKNNPTQKNSPFRLPIRGVPMPKEMPEPAVPKGWKMNTILPLHSPALTGGGVSDNFLQDMMAEMQGDMGAVAGPGGAGGSKKKEKKKK